MSATTVTSKGQVTIPAEIRSQFGIQSGDQLVFYAGLDGQLRVRVRRPRVGAGRGMIPHDGSDVTREQIGAAVADGVASRLDPPRKTGHRKGKAA